MTAAVQIEGENVKKLLKSFHLADGLFVPHDAVTSRLGFFGQSESGKTFAAMVFGEEMLAAGAQVVAVDDVGVWYGWRVGADGRSKGFNVYVFGGIHADFPITPKAGAVIARTIVQTGISAVIDLSEFTISEKTQFMIDWAETIFQEKKKNQSPLHVFWEEAHEWAPAQLPPDPRAGIMMNRVVRLWKTGRNYGIGNTAVTQQPQALLTAVRSQIDALFIGRMPGKHERKAVADWVADKSRDAGLADRLNDELPDLPTGDAFAVCGRWFGEARRVHIRAKTTYDSSATPKFGQAQREVKFSKLDTESVAKAIEASGVDLAADDPATLKKRIAQLEAELRKKSTHASAPAKVEEKRVEVPALRKGEAEKLAAVAERIAKTVAQLVDLGAGIRKGLAAVARPPVRPAPLVALPVGYFRATPRQPSAHRLPTEPVDGAIPPAAVRILQALARANGQVSVIRLATLTGYRPSGGGFRNLLGMLHSRGLIVRPAAGMTEITAAGLAEAGDVVPPQTVDEVRAMWREKLLPANWRVLEAIMDAADGIEVAALAEATGYQPSGGGFRNILGMLASNALITRPMPGVVRASEELMGGNG